MNSINARDNPEGNPQKSERKLAYEILKQTSFNTHWIGEYFQMKFINQAARLERDQHVESKSESAQSIVETTDRYILFLNEFLKDHTIQDPFWTRIRDRNRHHSKTIFDILKVQLALRKEFNTKLNLQNSFETILQNLYRKDFSLGILKLCDELSDKNYLELDNSERQLLQAFYCFCHSFVIFFGSFDNLETEMTSWFHKILEQRTSTSEIIRNDIIRKIPNGNHILDRDFKLFDFNINLNEFQRDSMIEKVLNGLSDLPFIKKSSPIKYYQWMGEIVLCDFLYHSEPNEISGFVA